LHYSAVPKSGETMDRYTGPAMIDRVLDMSSAPWVQITGSSQRGAAWFYLPTLLAHRVGREIRLMPKFRKKPVVIEAQKFDGGTASLSFDFFSACGVTPSGGLIMKTLEGEMLVSIGDWIIRGVKGEFYPCKPDIFEASYEVAE
jgi:hypothetical protein